MATLVATFFVIMHQSVLSMEGHMPATAVKNSFVMFACLSFIGCAQNQKYACQIHGESVLNDLQHRHTRAEVKKYLTEKNIPYGETTLGVPDGCINVSFIDKPELFDPSFRRGYYIKVLFDSQDNVTNATGEMVYTGP